MLYTKEFYERALTRLNVPHGVFATQAGLADCIPAPRNSADETDPSCYGPISNTLGAVFDCAILYSTNIPSFGSDWGFVMAFQAPTDKIAAEAALETRTGGAAVDTMISDRISGGEAALGHYDGVTHQRMFALPKSLRKALAGDDRIMTKDKPIFMF
jgi:spermidine synthase